MPRLNTRLRRLEQAAAARESDRVATDYSAMARAITLDTVCAEQWGAIRDRCWRRFGPGPWSLRDLVIAEPEAAGEIKALWDRLASVVPSARR